MDETMNTALLCAVETIIKLVAVPVVIEIIDYSCLSV